MSHSFRLYLVRHGQSANNALPTHKRVSDPALTKLGMTQADNLGQRFYEHVAAGNRIDLILTSPFLRTMQTIKPTAKALDMRPEIRSQLYEVGGCFDGYQQGCLTGQPGMTDLQIAEQFPEMQIPPDIDNKGWYKSKPFETWTQAERRAEQLSNALKQEFIGSGKAVVCTIHADLIGLMMGVFCKNNPSMADTVVSNTSITLLSFEPDQSDIPEVIYFNDAAHLAPHELSH